MYDNVTSLMNEKLTDSKLKYDQITLHWGWKAYKWKNSIINWLNLTLIGCTKQNNMQNSNSLFAVLGYNIQMHSNSQLSY